MNRSHRWFLSSSFSQQQQFLRSQQRLAAVSTLVVSEPLLADGSISPSTQSTVTAANKLAANGDGNNTISLLLCDAGVPTEIPEGVTDILRIVSDEGGLRVSETIASAIEMASKEKGEPFDYIIASASKFGSTVVPRAASLLKLSPVTDVIEIVSEDTFIRPMYAGNALAEVRATDTPTKLLSVRPTSFEKADLVLSDFKIQDLNVPAFDKAVFVGEVVSTSGDRPDLGAASIVVSGGRGLKSGENFALLEKLADKLGDCAVGASRAAVDAGMVSNDHQVGQTGKVVAPDLYIAVGISGAIQHLSGMKDSKTIVAINTDAEAPIFSVADYGLQADLFEAIPEITEKVK